MPAPKGNQFWKQRSSHGRSPKFDDPSKLWEACCEYFEWVEAHPLEEALTYQGEVMEKSLPKMQAMTLTGLRVFIDISDDTWTNYKQNQDLIGVIKKVEDIIYTQKFTGAAAGMLNPNIIARDLGLADKQDQTLSSPSGGPVEVNFVPVSNKHHESDKY